MPLIIYPEDSDNEEDKDPNGQLRGTNEATIAPPSMENTFEHRPQRKTRKQPLNPSLLCLIRALCAHKGKFHGSPIPRIYCEISKWGRSTQIYHPGGVNQRGRLERKLECSDFEPIREPRHRRIHPKYEHDTIPTPHKLGGSGKVFGRILPHEGGYGHAVVNPVPLRMGLEGYPGLASQDEPLHFQIPTHNIQEVNNPQ